MNLTLNPTDRTLVPAGLRLNYFVSGVSADIRGHCRETPDASAELLFSRQTRDIAIINWFPVDRTTHVAPRVRSLSLFTYLPWQLFRRDTVPSDIKLN